jgi:hypothetical protein
MIRGANSSKIAHKFNPEDNTFDGNRHQHVATMAKNAYHGTLRYADEGHPPCSPPHWIIKESLFKHQNTVLRDSRPVSRV